jgi:hypothetical protein
MRPYKVGNVVFLREDRTGWWYRGKRGVIINAFVSRLSHEWTYQVQWDDNDPRLPTLHTMRTIKKR